MAAALSGFAPVRFGPDPETTAESEAVAATVAGTESRESANETHPGYPGLDHAPSNATSYIGIPAGRAGHGIVLSVHLPDPQSAPHNALPGNPRGVRSGYVAEAQK